MGIESPTDSNELEQILADTHPADLASAYEALPEEDLVQAVLALPIEYGAQVFEHLSPEPHRVILNTAGADKVWPLVSELSPDDIVDLLQELSHDSAQALVQVAAKKDPELSSTLERLMAFGPDTAGGLMTTEFVSIAPKTSASEATEKLRNFARERNAELIYYVFVVDEREQLLGVASLRDLILADADAPISDFMTSNVISVLPKDDQEKVAATIAKYNFAAVPVVNRAGRMVGIVTVDDVVDVVIEEATEDAQMMGGVVPLEESYLNTRYSTMIWKRVTWLLVLFGGQLLTTSVMEHNSDALALSKSLLIFLPLIIASGGNSGSQSSSLVIRALAIGELSPGDWLRVLYRELWIGLSLGVVLSLIGIGRALFADDASISLAVSVGSSIITVVTIGSLLGSLLPMAIHKAGLDPAVSSTPFIASLVDVIGLLAFFSVAQFVFTQWPG